MTRNTFWYPAIKYNIINYKYSKIICALFYAIYTSSCQMTKKPFYCKLLRRWFFSDQAYKSPIGG